MHRCYATDIDLLPHSVAVQEVVQLPCRHEHRMNILMRCAHAHMLLVSQKWQQDTSRQMLLGADWTSANDLYEVHFWVTDPHYSV